jgi:hypothetical protein
MNVDRTSDPQRVITSTPDVSSAERVAFWLVAVCACCIHWLPHFPPQADLAQHAAQIRLLHDWNRPDFAYRSILELNFFTPYLPAYLLGAALSFVMPTVFAIKTIWTLGAFGTVFMSVRLRRRLAGSACWDWLVIPGLFGVAYHWGMVTFLLAIPLGLAALEFWIVLLESPSRRGSLAFGVGLLALFFAHSLVTGWVMVVAGSILLARVVQLKMPIADAARVAVPLVMPVPLLIAWLAFVRNTAQANQPAAWLPLEYRFFAFFEQWLGVPLPVAPVSTLAALVLCAPFIAGVRVRREPAAIVPLIVTLTIVLFGPGDLLGNTLTSSRFYLLVGPCLVLAMSAHHSTRPTFALARLLTRIGVVACVGIAGKLTLGFAAEQADVVRLMRHMTPGQHTLSIVPDGSSRVYKSPWPYTHFPVWYQAETGGLVEFSFASFYPMIVRFRRDYHDAVPLRFANDKTPDWRSLRVDQFQYIIVRGAARDSAPAIDVPGTLMAHEGRWLLYSRTTK